MTPQEQQLLDDFLGRLAAAGSVTKDAQADAMIRQRLAAQPDAAYLLVQRALLLERALEAAREQITQLQQQQQQQQAAREGASGGSSFLGSAPPDVAFGRGAVASGAASAAPMARPAPPATSAPPSGWRERLFGSGGGPAAPAPAPAPAPATAPATGAGFLGQAARTAAGVAGGMFLFNGLGNLLGHHGAAAGPLGGSSNSLLGGTPPDTVVQNITNENFFPDDQLAGRNDADEFRSEAPSDDGFLDPGDGSDFQDDGDSFI